jgi:hypothetical protein
MSPFAPLPTNAEPLGQAVLAAYKAFGGSTYTPPSGWTYVTSLTGWDDIFWDLGRVELFALVFTNGSGQYLVAIRGTDSDTDFYEDLWADTVAFAAHGGSGLPSPAVAAGFNSIYTGTGGGMPASMQGQVWSLIQQDGITNLVVTGHSLGGALAQLMGFDVAVSAPSITLQVLTFAAPMVGLQDWGRDYATAFSGGNSVSVVNQYDLVPHYPPLGDYVPVGVPFDIAFERSSTGWDPVEDVIIRHEMDNYFTVVRNIIQANSAPWVGTFEDGVYAGVTDESYAPSGVGAAVVKAELAKRAKA